MRKLYSLRRQFRKGETLVSPESFGSLLMLK